MKTLPQLLYSVVLFVILAVPMAKADIPAAPKGVIFVLIDDIGYGDIDAFYPSSLETPELDRLANESIRLMDFHTGTTCAPSRGQLMTGRSANAVGAWHTVSGRELLRENEVTLAEVFQANDWETGIFGKWHLGEGYPFSPRFRGFDIAVIHGGGGIGQSPDYYGNDYYSGVNQNGSPTQADVYMENGEFIEADQHCTDYWFTRAKTFVKENADQNKPFFCMIACNAAHAPLNEPYGYKDGFDGLIENIDDNMGALDAFLVAEGIKDDVLVVFTSDNGTRGSERLGGLRGIKGSRYDGGHNVPCFLRWENGGIAGTTSRDVPSLTSITDFLPTFVDLFGMSMPAGGQPLHGISLKEHLTNPAYVQVSRTLIVDTQRITDIRKWREACVMKDEVSGGVITNKWRLVRESSSASFELFDFLVDRDTDDDISASNAAVVSSLESVYDSWWTEVSQNAGPFNPFVLNDEYEDELTLFAHSWIGNDLAPWNQGGITSAASGTRTHAIRFDRSGNYRFELRRWPREDGGAIGGKNSAGGGTVVPAVKVRMTLAGIGEMTQTITPGDAAAIFEKNVQAGPQTTLVTALLDENDQVLKGAYYVYIRRVEDDITPPTPNPMSFTLPPAPLDTTSIAMTATSASDTSTPVEYFFENTTTSNNSGWTTDASWLSTDLTTGQSYDFRVRVRDAWGNMGEWSAVSSVVPAEDTTAPNPNPMTWETPPNALSENAISMTATTAADANGVEYYFTNLTVTNGSHDSGWQSGTNYTDSGLTPETPYTYTVAARDKSDKNNVTIASAVESVSTLIVDENLILNGGFELNAAGDEQPASWTIVDAADQVKDNTGGLDGLAPQEGTKMFQLQVVGGSNPKTSGISQTLTVTTAGKYELSGWFAPRDHAFGSTNYTFTLTDLLSAPVVADISSDPALTKGAWNEITRTYNSLAAGNYTVTFINTGTANLLQGSVDAFSFTFVGTLPPESIGEIDFEILPGSSEMGFSWYGEAGATYGLEMTEDLTSDIWQTVTNVSGADEIISLTDEMDQTNAFYRVKLVE